MVGSAKGGRVLLNKARLANVETLHPSELEFAHYLRGSLARGHAAALFAHTLLCQPCRDLLEAQLAEGQLVRVPGPGSRTEEPGC